MDIQIPLLLTHGLGFLITLFILKKFAWGPLLQLIEERREKIISEFKSIEDGKANIEKLTAEYQGKLREIDDERRQKIVEAVTEGKKIAEDIKSAAKDEAKSLGEKAKAELEGEVAKAKVQLKNDMVYITVKAAEKIVNEKLDDEKHRELIANFIGNLEKA